MKIFTPVSADLKTRINAVFFLILKIYKELEFASISMNNFFRKNKMK